jgi:hypothetical protein
VSEVKGFEVANPDDPRAVAKATQRAIIAAMKSVIDSFRNEPGRPGLTWEQIDFILDEFGKKEPLMFKQEYEL